MQCRKVQNNAVDYPNNKIILHHVCDHRSAYNKDWHFDLIHSLRCYFLHAFPYGFISHLSRPGFQNSKTFGWGYGPAWQRKVPNSRQEDNLPEIQTKQAREHDMIWHKKSSGGVASAPTAWHLTCIVTWKLSVPRCLRDAKIHTQCWRKRDSIVKMSARLCC